MDYIKIDVPRVIRTNKMYTLYINVLIQLILIILIVNILYYFTLHYIIYYIML